MPEDASLFLLAWTLQWSVELPGPEEADDEQWQRAMDRQTADLLGQHGGPEMADLFLHHRMEYERRRERGRQFSTARRVPNWPRVCEKRASLSETKRGRRCPSPTQPSIPVPFKTLARQA